MEPIRRKPSAVECAYLAGFIDGEGCIGIYGALYKGRRHRNALHLVLANTDLRPLIWTRERWGGFLAELTVKKAHYRRSYQLVLNEPYSTIAIEDAFPYLVMKKDQAMVALEFRDLRKGRYPGCRGTPESHWEAADALFERLSALKNAHS